MALLTINNVDFTSKINQRKYNVQKQPVYTTWTDGNHVTHRSITRTRVSGSFTMSFLSAAEFDAFNAAVNAVKTVGGYLPLTVYVNNTKESLTINAFLDYDAMLVWTQVYDIQTGSTPALASVSVKLSER
jgi:hypothetical protein